MSAKSPIAEAAEFLASVASKLRGCDAAVVIVFGPDEGDGVRSYSARFVGSKNETLEDLRRRGELALADSARPTTARERAERQGFVIHEGGKGT